MWKEYKLDELLFYEQPTQYIVKSTEYNDNYKTPVLTAGKSFILGYTNEENGIFDKLPVIIFDDFTTASRYVNFKFKVKSSAMKILIPNTELVLPKFIFYCLQLINIDHSTHKRYWIQHYSKIKIKIPPTHIQEMLIKEIDVLFSKFNEVTKYLIKLKKEIENYRYSIIDTEIVCTYFKSIKECIYDMGQGWSPKCEKENIINDDEWAVIKTTAVQACKFIYQENKKLPNTIIPREKHEIKEGDILITRAGPKNRCGICCMVKETKKRLLNCDKVYRIKVNPTIILPQYLEYVLNSPDFLQKINLCKTGGNDSGLNLTQERFLNIKIPVPDLKTQKIIIENIQAKISICEKIEEIIEETINKSDVLKRSILNNILGGNIF